MISETQSLDADYRIGRPKVYLAPIEVARLVIARSKLGDTRAEHEAQKISAAGSPRTHGWGNEQSA